MADPVSGAAGTTASASSTPAAPAATVIPDGSVVLAREEHNRNQADLRRAQKALRDKEEADAAAARAAELTAAEERREYDRAVQVERDENERLQRQLQETRATDALRDEISSRGLAGPQADAVRALACVGDIAFNDDGTPSHGSVSGAVDTVMQRYGPALRESSTVAGDPPPRSPRAPGPATPPPPAIKPDGYVSPEEYASTPVEVRRTPAFQARVELSRSSWPTTQHRSVFEPAGG